MLKVLIGFVLGVALTNVGLEKILEVLNNGVSQIQDVSRQIVN
jgi:hypothetical protein